MTVIINFNSTAELDKSIIPNAIYNETINKEKIKIQDYFILHPLLLYSFVGYNGALKLANQLSSNKKCGCYYKIPWKTYYEVNNNTSSISLSFSQQVEEYRYMIKFWYPSPEISYMQYLSEIALSMILDISQFLYYRDNNLETCTIFQKKYYTNNFKNQRQFYLYVIQNFSKNKNYIPI
jgi:hypothetical protein